MNVCAPNFDDTEFSNRLLSNIPHLNTHLLIFGGDLNCVFDPVLDRSSPRTIPQSAMSKSFSNFMTQSGLVDLWRLRNRSAIKCSYFSHVHKSYSRINYFFIDNSLNSSVVSSDYSSILISDHAPLFLDIQPPNHKSNSNYFTPLCTDQNFPQTLPQWTSFWLILKIPSLTLVEQ